jgi:hypothetical protein
MTKELAVKLEDKDWYKALVEEADAIIVEAGEASRWALVEGYHQLGTRILEENKNFEREKIYGQEITKRISQSLGKSIRTIEKAVQFAKEYKKPEEVPGGKAITWGKVCNVVLVGKDINKQCGCSRTETREYCIDCGKRIKNETSI